VAAGFGLAIALISLLLPRHRQHEQAQHLTGALQPKA
jgi:hypothetical protein